MKISIVIPFYNNEQSIDELFQRLRKVVDNKIFDGHNIEFVLVDDGSEDESYSKLNSLLDSELLLNLSLVKLTRNFGSYNAFLAGIHHANGDCCVYLHADMQDPPELIATLFENFLKGVPLVLANRHSRDDGSFFSYMYHFLVKKLALKNAPPGGFDLVLFDNKIREEILSISEKNTNNVYLINWLGYPYISIPYNREKRKYGKSQWKFLKKVQLFVDTFFSFSNIPIQLIRFCFYSSIVFVVFSIVLYSVLSDDNSLMVLLSSIIIFIVSFNAVILSEYLDRIHETVRNRPNFVVENVLKNHT